MRRMKGMRRMSGTMAHLLEAVATPMVYPHRIAIYSPYASYIPLWV